MKIKKVSKQISTYALVLTAVWIVLAIAVIHQQNLAEKVIRIHILANSDSVADQTEKLEVRDAILEMIETKTANCQTRAEAAAVLQNAAEEIGRTASEMTGRNVEVSLAPEWYNTREYDHFSLPAGRYLSLQIKLGAAAGKNWWCVAFPAICTNAVTADWNAVATSGGLDEQDLHLMVDHAPDVTVRYYLLEKIYALYEALTAR